jgi:2,3-bisphosphoglycerate-independent phosphoglycerate mutase
MKLLFIFLDGVGLGEDKPEINPLAGRFMPHLEEILEGHKLIADGNFRAIAEENCLVNTHWASLLALDACLGIDGLPQSASGQASLLTGKNVSALLGIHEGPKPTPPIIELLKDGTVFTHLQRQGKQASLLNAFPPRYFEAIESGYRIPGVIALSLRLAGIPLKTLEDLVAGEAISADFTAQGWRNNLGLKDIPILDGIQAGDRIKQLSESTDLAVFEYWLTDIAGHHQDMQSAQSILETLDTVIESLMTFREDDDKLIMLTSDHGNLEDLNTRHHTRYDVPLLLLGPAELRKRFIQNINQSQGSRLKPDLTDVAPAILDFIEQMPEIK